MGNIGRTGDYGAGNYANGSDVEGDLDTIITEFNGNIETINLADACVTNVKLANGIVDSNKLGTQAVRETHMKWSQASSGVLAWRAGPNYAPGGTQGGRIARVQKQTDWTNPGPDSVTFTYSSDCLDGDPVFSAGSTPTLMGAPAMVTVGAASVDAIDEYLVTASSNTAITISFAHGASTATVDLEFAVSGPVST